MPDDAEQNAVAVPDTMDAPAWLGKHLEDDEAAICCERWCEPSPRGRWPPRSMCSAAVSYGEMAPSG